MNAPAYNLPGITTQPAMGASAAPVASVNDTGAALAPMAGWVVIPGRL